jgi:poly-beta-1,6-N-acetyl-D-glucosamine synthase
MPNTPRYVVITPVRNEKDNLPSTIECFATQTIRPAKWTIVDDGSTDGTSAIADAAAAGHPWIHVIHRVDRGFRLPGQGVMEAFHEGLAATGDQEWDYLVKFDGDLSFEADYFERCFERFDRSPRLGIGGGMICWHDGNGLVVESMGDPPFHVRGATKIYRRACWAEIGGLVNAPGWDTIDELKANMLGWQTGSFHDLKVHQLKFTGSADGYWKNWVKNGLANYITGYHPLFMLIKCLKRAFTRPYGWAAAGLFCGFLKGYLRRIPRGVDAELLRYIRRQQMNRLWKRPSLWDATATNASHA